MGRIADIANRKFGRLTAIRFAGDGKWFCRCDCGGKATILTSNLTRSRMILIERKMVELYMLN